MDNIIWVTTQIFSPSRLYLLGTLLLAGGDLVIVRRGFFVVKTSHCSSELHHQGMGAAVLLSMLTRNGEDLSFVCANDANVWRGQDQAGK